MSSEFQLEHDSISPGRFNMGVVMDVVISKIRPDLIELEEDTTLANLKREEAFRDILTTAGMTDLKKFSILVYSLGSWNYGNRFVARRLATSFAYQVVDKYTETIQQ